MSRELTDEEREALRYLRVALYFCEQQGIEVRHGSPGVYVISRDDTWSIASADDFLQFSDFDEAVGFDHRHDFLWQDWHGDDAKRPEGLVHVVRRDGTSDCGHANSFLWQHLEDPVYWDIVRWKALR